MPDKLRIVSTYTDEELGVVRLKNGRAVADNRKLGAFLDGLFVPDPDTGEPAKPQDGERYMRALQFGLRGGVAAVEA